MAVALRRGKILRAGVLLAWSCASANALAVAAAPAGGLSAALAGGAGMSARRAVTSLPEIPFQGEFQLTPRLLLQLTLARNADALYSQLASEVAGHLAQAELGLFEVVAYGGLRHEDRKRQRTAQEKESSLVTSGQSVLDEQVETGEMGLKRKLGSGGELSLSYRLTKRSNNLIEKVNASSTNPTDTEYDGALALTFKQPLLRGFGSAAVEADRKIAELDWAIGKQQYKQQMLRSGSEALAAYWQLYRAHEALRIRQDALRKAVAAQDDIETRIAGGRLPPRTVLEARSAVSSRMAEKLRAEQSVNEAESKIKTLLNLAGAAYGGLRLLPGQQSAQTQAPAPAPADAQRLEQVLQSWPSYRIADLKRQQGMIRLDFASNQKRPVLDLAASCSSTYLSTSGRDTSEKVFSRDYPDCYIGLNLEIPIEGNLRAKSQLQAQRVRLSQSDVEIEAVRATLANDLELRARQLDRAIMEVAEYRKDVDLRAQMLEMEQKQFQFGMSRLSQVIARENELNASRESLLDSQARLELARVALQVADGSLFGEYAVEWQGD
jgi:outer membrane protein TolC